jgi:hypothetical protein
MLRETIEVGHERQPGDRHCDHEIEGGSERREAAAAGGGDGPSYPRLGQHERGYRQ